MSRVKMILTLVIARAIILGRTMLKIGAIKQVAVTNVSFEKSPGEPHQKDDWNDGAPYAIANFNLVNPFKKAEAIGFFSQARETQDVDERAELLRLATNCNLSQRVSLELGKKLMEAGSATVIGANRTWTNEEGEEITSILIKKSIPNMPEDASDNGAFTGNEEAFELTEEELAGAPQ